MDKTAMYVEEAIAKQHKEQEHRKPEHEQNNLEQEDANIGPEQRKTEQTDEEQHVEKQNDKEEAEGSLEQQTSITSTTHDLDAILGLGVSKSMVN